MSPAIPRSIYPFEGRFFDRGGGIRMHYLDEGPKEGAEVVVMVHGNPTWSIHFRALLLALRDRYRCLVPDHVGMGLSDKPQDDRYDYTLSERVADLGRWIDAVVPAGTKITLVAHDWGGMIATAWATQHPERVERCVLMNTAAFPKPTGKRFPPALALTRTPLGAVLVRGGNAFARTAARVCTTKKRMPEALRRAYTAPYASWQDRIATLRFVEDIPLGPGDRAWKVVADTEARLATLADVPMLFCWGMKDFVFDHHFLDELVRHFPTAEVHRFEAAGHYVLEDEEEAIVPIVRSFLERHPAH